MKEFCWKDEYLINECGSRNVYMDRYYFWKNKNGIVVDGYSFDDDFGLEEDKWHYRGDFSIISRTNHKKIYNGTVDVIHYSRYGLKWIVNYDVDCFILPFLITSNKNMNLIYSGEIHILATEEFKRYKKKAKCTDGMFQIISENCLANLRIEGGFYYIDLFSNVSNMNISNIYTENFRFAGYDEPIIKLLYD